MDKFGLPNCMFTLDTITNTKYPTKKTTDLIFAESRELHEF
jgi:hypothetical protein